MAYYVPDLGCSLFSVRQHAHYQGCYFHAENNTCILAFPDFMINPTMDPEIMVYIKKPSQPIKMDFNETIADLAETPPLAKGLVAKQTYLHDHFTLNQKTKFAKEVAFHLRHELASLPNRGSPDAIGYDITSVHSMTIDPGTTAKIHTGLACAIPKGIYGRLASRSRLAAKAINVQGGVIDPDYKLR